MIEHECEQLSPLWWELRRGIPTASNFGKIITPTGRLSTSAEGYMRELMAEEHDPCYPRITPPTEAMANGTALEPDARALYELARSITVRRVGFITDDAKTLGCSPDGLVGEDGGLELKCPSIKTHIGYLLDGVLPEEYRAQVHGNLLITRRKWWDFVSYCPHVKPAMFVVQVGPQSTYYDSLRVYALGFVETLAKARKKLLELGQTTRGFPGP